jgi:hypothetical protein
MTSSTTDRALEELLAERAIRQLLIRYSRGIDRCDEALLLSVYHDDATDDHGEFKGSGHDFARWVIPILRERFAATMHDLGNMAIHFDGARPDRARAETYVVAYHVTRAEAQSLVTVGARYLDRVERRDGEWRISHRSVVIDWSQVAKIDGTFPTDKYLVGSQSADDPSYDAY